MPAKSWSAKLRFIDRAFLRKMEKEIGCGPFNGGCLVVAQALHSVIGGEICVLTDKEDYALHAVVLKDGMLWDYDGPMNPTAFLDRYNSCVQDTRYLCVAHRPLKGHDLTEAMENEVLAKRLANMIRYILPAHTKSGDGLILAIQRSVYDDIPVDGNAFARDVPSTQECPQNVHQNARRM